MKISKISFIGAGNVATNLAIAFYNSGIKIKSIYSRNIKNAINLASKTDAIPTDNIGDIDKNSDLYIISVPDNAIESILNNLSLVLDKEARCVHTSGSLPIEIFKNYFKNYGSLYFLQTFTKTDITDLTNVPCLINSNSLSFSEELKNLGFKVSQKVDFIDDKQKKTLHIAAVFSNNFVNYLFSISKKISEDNKVKFEYLYPLIQETCEKIIKGNDPKSIQTGPAIRKDYKTMEEHEQYLKTYNENYEKIYKLLSDELIKNGIK
ncbi:MAG: DUF2520 domain-containing protein [Saprospiraceae bacterium]